MPVAVSLCTAQIALISPAASAVSASRKAARSTPIRRSAGLNLETMTKSHLRPLVGEEAGLQHQDRIARGQQAGQARFPGAVAGGVVHEQMPAGAQHALHAGEGLIVDLLKVRIVEVDTGPVHRPQHAVGDVGRAGIGEELTAPGLGTHCLLLMGWSSYVLCRPMY